MYLSKEYLIECAKKHSFIKDTLEKVLRFKNIIYNLDDDSKLFYEYEDDDPIKCGDAFQKANIFNGKSFWEVERNIEWLDE